MQDASNANERFESLLPLLPGVVRIERASEAEKAKILEVEIPARMEAMHTLTSTYPDIVMVQAKRDLVLRP